MKKQTKFLVTAAMILIATQTAMASKVVSDVKLTDGTHIRKCQFNNGVVKYCTQEDAINDMRAFNNFSLIPQSEVKKTGQQLYKMTGDKRFLEPTQYNNSKNNNYEKAAQAEKLKFQSEFPVAKKIETTLIQYEKEYNELLRKHNLGLPYDEKRFEMLESKINVLNDLYGEGAQYTNPYVTGYSNLTIKGTQSTYNNLSDKLKKKEITQDEFNYLKAKLVINAGKLEDTYNKVVNSTEKVLFAGEEPLNGKDVESETVESTKETKLEKTRRGVGTGVNILNDTMNSVRSIQSMFGI